MKEICCTCDGCGVQLGPFHVTTRLTTPFKHWGGGTEVRVEVDMCQSCAGGLLEALTGRDETYLVRFWEYAVKRWGWFQPGIAASICSGQEIPDDLPLLEFHYSRENGGVYGTD